MRSKRSRRVAVVAAWSCLAMMAGSALTAQVASAQTPRTDTVTASSTSTNAAISNAASAPHQVLGTRVNALPSAVTTPPTTTTDNSTAVTVTFSAQDQQISSLTGMTYNSTIEPSQVPTAPVKQGFDFLGWFFGPTSSPYKYRVSVFPFVLSQIPANVRTSINNTISLKAMYGHNAPANPIQKDGYRLVFDDEFNGNTLSTHNWVNKYLSSWSKSWQQTTNHVVKDGQLSLRINANTQPWAPEFDGQTVISGIETAQRNGLHNWTGHNQVRNPADPEVTHINRYGYYEMRMRGQPGSSRHSAWWLLGFQNTPQETTEIDIFEVLGKSPHTFASALHEWKDHHVFQSTAGMVFSDNSKDLTNEYHVYGFNWEKGAGSGAFPDKITVYVDGKEYGSRNVDIRYPLLQLISQYEKRAGGWTGPWEWQPYPNTMNVDYVRVYKKIPQDATCKTNPVVTAVENPVANIDQENVALATYGTFTEKDLTGTPEYANVHWSDGTVTQEPTTWDAVTAHDIEQLKSGVNVTKHGTIHFATLNSPVKTLPVTMTLHPVAVPYSSNGITLTGSSLDYLFDKQINQSNKVPSAVFQLTTATARADKAYITYNFGKKVQLDGVDMWTNYGNNQGIKSFKVATWNDTTHRWTMLQQNGHDAIFPLRWRTAAAAAERIHVNLNAGQTSRVRLFIHDFGYTWNHVAMREIGFTTRNVPGQTAPSTSSSPVQPTLTPVPHSSTCTPAADKTALRTEADKDVTLAQSDYTKASWDTFAQALAKAQSVLADEYATQQQVDAALKALTTAREGLVRNAHTDGSSPVPGVPVVPSPETGKPTPTPTPTPTPVPTPNPMPKPVKPAPGVVSDPSKTVMPSTPGSHVTAPTSPVATAGKHADPGLASTGSTVLALTGLLVLLVLAAGSTMLVKYRRS